MASMNDEYNIHSKNKIKLKEIINLLCKTVDIYNDRNLTYIGYTTDAVYFYIICI